MGFSQGIINQVQEKAAFRCCRCWSIGIEVHHILSKKDGGIDTFDNAVPLCPNCHSWFGDNPIKRKKITHMRNWRYKIVKKLYSPNDVNYQLLSEINSKVDALASNQDKALVNLKKTLKKTATNIINQMTAGTARTTASGIANAINASPSPSPSFPPLDEMIESEECLYCRSGLVKFGEMCPHCGNVCRVP